jgi:hypothetical protein
MGKRTRRFGIQVEFPNLDAFGNQMTLCADVVCCQALLCSLMKMLQDEEYFSIVRRGHAEEQHNLIHPPDLSARRFPRLCPCVRFAFDQDGWTFASKIEIMPFFEASADRNGESRTDCDTSVLEEKPSCFFELTTGVRIANGAAPLEVIWIGHDVSSVRASICYGKFRQLVPNVVRKVGLSAPP